jgi:hypothetical protein
MQSNVVKAAQIRAGERFPKPGGHLSGIPEIALIILKKLQNPRICYALM